MGRILQPVAQSTTGQIRTKHAPCTGQRLGQMVEIAARLGQRMHAEHRVRIVAPAPFDVAQPVKSGRAQPDKLT